MPITPTIDNLEIKSDSHLKPDTQDTINKIKKANYANYALNSGIGGGERLELVANYSKTDVETIYPGKTNALIILGNDRNSGPLSGYSGIGFTSCASIDLVAGLSGIRPIEKDASGATKTNKNFQNDAARVYISQKSNIDEYLKIPKMYYAFGQAKIVGDNSVDKSAVALIADCVRLKGRNTIKLVTLHNSQDSTNNDVEIGGIDLIAGIDAMGNEPSSKHTLQPMVKGDNLQNFLRELMVELRKMTASTERLFDQQNKINTILLNHTHQTGGTPGALTSRPVEDRQLKSATTKLVSKSATYSIELMKRLAELQNKRLAPTAGPDWINSHFNRVN